MTDHSGPVSTGITEEDRMTADIQASARASADEVLAQGIDAAVGALCGEGAELDHRARHLVAARLWRLVSPEQVLRLALHASDGELRALAFERVLAGARRSPVDPTVVVAAARDPWWEVRRLAAVHAVLPRSVLVALALDSDAAVRRSVSERAEVDRSVVLDALQTEEPWAQHASVATSPLLDARRDALLLRNVGPLAARALLPRQDLPQSLFDHFASTVYPDAEARALLRLAVLQHPRCTAAQVGLLSTDEVVRVRVAVAASALAGPAVLERLAVDPEAAVRAVVARNRACPPARLTRILQEDPEVDVRLALLRNPSVSAAAVALAARDADQRVRTAAVLHGAAGPAVLRDAVVDPDVRVRLAVLRNAACPDDAFVTAAGDEHEQVREAVAACSSAPGTALSLLAEDQGASIRQRVARHGNTTGEAIGRILLGDDEAARLLAAAHPGAPAEVLHQVVLHHDDLALRRAALANGNCLPATVSFAIRSKELVLAAVKDRDLPKAELYTALAMVGAAVEELEAVPADGLAPGESEELQQLRRHRSKIIGDVAKQPHRWIRSQEAYAGLPVALRVEVMQRNLQHLADDPDVAMRLGAVAHPFMTAKVLVRFAKDPAPEVRWRVASHELADAPLLDIMSTDEFASVRCAVAAHAAVTPAILQRLADDPDESVQVAVTARLLEAYED